MFGTYEIEANAKEEIACDTIQSSKKLLAKTVEICSMNSSEVSLEHGDKKMITLLMLLILNLIRLSASSTVPPCFINVSLSSTIGLNGIRILRMISELQASGSVIGVEITEHGVHMGHAADAGRFIRMARDQGLYVALDGVTSNHPYSRRSFAWKAGVTHAKIKATEERFDVLASEFFKHGIQVIAKHIEKQDQLLRVKEYSDFLQGNLIAPPVSIANVALRKRSLRQKHATGNGGLNRSIRVLGTEKMTVVRNVTF